MVSTGDRSYGYVLRPRITIKTVDGSDTLYTYDSFSSSNDINVTGLDVEGAVGESGTFGLQIADHNNLIPKDNIHNVKVFVEMGKTSAYTGGYFMIGYGDLFRTDRAITNSQVYSLTGFGSSIWASQLMIHRREKFKKSDTDAQIWKIVKAALTKRLWRPLKSADDSIEDITGWSPDGISEKVNIPFTVFDKAYVYFNDVLDELCDISGAVWFINFEPDGSEKFTLTYNSNLYTNIKIKSGDLQDRINDPATTTSYIKNQFVVEDGATTEAGIATRLITTTIQDKQRVIELADGTGSTALDFRAIAQQVIIDNDARRLDSLELRLSKDGKPDSPNSRVNGDIVLDVNNKPTGTVLDEFHIDLGSIKDSADWIEIADIDVSAKKLEAGQTKIWIRLFQRSGLTGDPTHDPSNTVKWHHSNAFNATQPYYSGSANEGDANKKDTLTWNVSNQGPVYTVRVNSNIRRMIARTNKAAANKIRMREVFVPTDFLDDPGIISKYLSTLLSQTSKPRRSIQEFMVTLPNDFIFKPYQWVSFQDGLSDIAQTLQVKRARYTFGGQSDDSQLGTLHCNLTLGGLYNTLTANCSCV